MYRSPSEADKPENARALNIIENGNGVANYMELLSLVQRDRQKLLDEQREKDPDSNLVALDPRDGDDHTTDQVVDWCNRVCARLDGNAGIYAYAGHRLPPTIDCVPNLMVQIALAFNQNRPFIRKVN